MDTLLAIMKSQPVGFQIGIPAAIVGLVWFSILGWKARKTNGIMPSRVVVPALLVVIGFMTAVVSMMRN